MENVIIQKQLSDYLTEILKYLITATEKLKIDKVIPKVLVTYWWMEQDEKGNGQGRNAQATETQKYEVDKLLDILISKNSEIADKITKFGEKAKSIAGDNPFPAFINNLVNNATSIARLIISIYLKETGELKVNKRIVQKVCKEFIRDTTSPTYSASFVFLVQNFRALRRFKLKKFIEFRPISENDYKLFSSSSWDIPSIQRKPWLGSRDWICTVESIGDKSSTAAFNSRTDILDLIAGALAIAQPGRAHFFFLSGRYKSVFFNFGTTSGGEYVYTSRSGGVITLDQQGIRRFQKAFVLVQQILKSTTYKSLRLPFRRLRLSSTRRDVNDSFVDYVISLERLLASDSENLEVTFRFRMRGAALLPKSFGTERERLTLMSKLYKLRSNIVHGNESAEEVEEFSQKIEQVFVSIFKTYAKLLTKYKTDSKLTEILDDALVKGGSSIIKRNLN
jgi:hypothetical protein